MAPTRRSLVAGLSASVCLHALAARAEGRALASDEDVRRILQARIDARHGVGLIVGLVDRSGARFVSAGRSDQLHPAAPERETVFEIASITKVFTSLLLMDMVRRGDVALDAPVDVYLPKDVRLPRRGGRLITMVDLATHTSGLPRDPGNLRPRDEDNPWTDYSYEDLRSLLRTLSLTRDIGGTYVYSNLGYIVLAWALERRAGLAYDALVRSRVLRPLGLSDTGVTLTRAQRGRLAKGYGDSLSLASYWDMGIGQGIGGLHSTADELIKMLSSVLGYRANPLKLEVEAQFSVVRPAQTPFKAAAIGWHIQTSPGGTVIWHDGGTGGFRTFAGYNRAAGTGAVVLSNVADDWGVQDIGFHLLAGDALHFP